MEHKAINWQTCYNGDQCKGDSVSVNFVSLHASLFHVWEYRASVRIHLAYFEVFPLQNGTVIYVISQSYSIAKRNYMSNADTTTVILFGPTMKSYFSD